MEIPQIDRKDLSYDGMSTRRLRGLLNNITTINEDLKYEGYKVTLKVKNNNLNIRYAINSGNWKDRSPKGVEISPHGIQIARKLAFKIGNAVRDGVYSEDWYKIEIVGVKPETIKPLEWSDVIERFPALWMQYRSGDNTSTDRQKAVSLKRYTTQYKSYWLYLDESLTEGLKTGDRWVAPIYGDWVHLFDLTNPLYPPQISKTLSRKVAAISDYFRHHKFELTPYSLRHAYAIRGRVLGIELMDMAASMIPDRTSIL